MLSFGKNDHVVASTDEVTYHSLSVADIDFGEEHYEVIEIGSLKWFFTNPDQLDLLSVIASEAAASMRESKGQRRCDLCREWTAEPLVQVHSHLYDDDADLCQGCSALTTGRAA